ncbi:hypothetical protein FQN57_007292 [Myotisia sp. PD_48]|nr:hypothetical protein FQN57_007292 [Myotisia sp. PD_48]
MSAKDTPAVPCRPTRSPNTVASDPSVPKIPPRPFNRSRDAKASPNIDSFAPSPFNDPLLGWQNTSKATSNIEPPNRPSSVALPSIGQEGFEYEVLDTQTAQNPRNTQEIEEPAETRNLHQNLHLHAPRPSLPNETSTAQVQAVTRTDCQNPSTSPDTERHNRSSSSRLETRGGLRSSSATSEEHLKPYQQYDEAGIPEIGQRVPMYPNAGDVQAPSPAPASKSPRFNNFQRGGRHSRASSRQESLPPGSYGLHGHGIASDDPFEKAWYEKHPRELARDEAQRGPNSPHPQYAMSSGDLNKIVQLSGAKLTDPGLMGTPDEEIGYIATEELASRLASPQKEVDPSHGTIDASVQGDSSSKEPGDHQRTTESREVEIHIKDPLHPSHHPDGFVPAPESVGSHDRDEQEAGETIDNVHILASDEINPNSASLHPALPPVDSHEKPFLKHEAESSELKDDTSPSLTKPKSQEDNEHTVPNLEIVEPDKTSSLLRDGSPQERWKSLPEQQQRFPSKDIWEDAPSSSQLQTTVSTPDIPRRSKRSDSGSLFETPEEELERVREASKLKEQSGLEEAPSYLDDFKNNQDRGPKQRFPSKDIWEEAPESQQLTASVETPELQETKPSIPVIPVRPARPIRRTSPEHKPSSSAESSKPSSPLELKKKPSIPERPKPQVPTRPTRQHSQDEECSVNKAPPVPKAKPTIPSRPMGSKIAALKAGFMSDLDNRLKLGPPAPKPKKDEVEEAKDQGPLTDARKGRARGPARRKPAAPAPAEPPARAPVPEIKIAEAWDVWSIDRNGNLLTPGLEPKPPTVLTGDNAVSTSPQVLSPELTTPPQSAESEALQTSKPPEVSEPVVPLPALTTESDVHQDNKEPSASETITSPRNFASAIEMEDENLANEKHVVLSPETRDSTSKVSEPQLEAPPGTLGWPEDSPGVSKATGHEPHADQPETVEKLLPTSDAVQTSKEEGAGGSLKES